MLNTIMHFVKAFDVLHRLIESYPDLRNFYYDANRYIKYNALINTKLLLNSGCDKEELMHLAMAERVSDKAINFVFESTYLAQHQSSTKTVRIIKDVMENAETPSILLANLAMLVSNQQVNARSLSQWLKGLLETELTEHFSREEKLLFFSVAEDVTEGFMQKQIHRFRIEHKLSAVA